MANFMANRPGRSISPAFLLTGLLTGLLFALVEYVARVDTDDPQALVPLLIRGGIMGVVLVASMLLVEYYLKGRFRQKRFAFIVMVRALLYTLVITVWLLIINMIWLHLSLGLSLGAAALGYLGGKSFLINLVTVFLALVMMLGVLQVNSLHRKGELVNFILGKYHQPREVRRIFAFIDLKDSTTIAEKLGHLQFGLFLKDYYSDITDAIRQTEGEIYLYVGDEIILSWPMEKGLRHNNAVRCFFLMRDYMESVKERYIRKYGFYPRFKTGIHGGPVIVTWVGELKKEIMYLGDVLNTASRIQESCKRLGKDCLISQGVLDRLEDPHQLDTLFLEETSPRGKEQLVRIYSIEAPPNVSAGATTPM
ncbi:MAG: adenylate/guanylate cyclase domain-containing protein [Bacteroidetes bacterium]|nr:MAG: adenylate/guanylate cyclase domain-containing protein [Bacteroidota bacterium]